MNIWELWHEAIAHCRHTTTLKTKVLPILTTQFNKGYYSTLASFEDIFIKISINFTSVYGIGNLTLYDLSIPIAQQYNLQPARIYCPGSGTKNALKYLNITPVSIKLGTRRIPSTSISKVKQAFQEKGWAIPEKIANSTNPDDWESFLCNWQKQFKSGSATVYHNPPHYTCTRTSN